MEYSLAPMEGVTTYIYRNALQDIFGGVDEFYSPFICPRIKRGLLHGEKEDILPAHNEGKAFVPQILTNQSQDFCALVERIHAQYGYERFNINLGCPSKTVVNRGKGSGFLAHPQELRQFLDDIFDRTHFQISVKTRIGISSPEEFAEILKVYREFPLEKLIVHARLQQEFYNGTPHFDSFMQAVEAVDYPVVYNGDINRLQDWEALWKGESVPEQVQGIMIGRGAIANPAIFRQMKGGQAATLEELKAFHDRLLRDYRLILDGDMPVLCKMKEVWFYMSRLFEDSEKVYKHIKKAKNLDEYRAAVREMWLLPQKE
jgi:tRNA-dihydrouridine synthase